MADVDHFGLDHTFTCKNVRVTTYTGEGRNMTSLSCHLFPEVEILLPRWLRKASLTSRATSASHRHILYKI